MAMPKSFGGDGMGMGGMGGMGGGMGKGCGGGQMAMGGPSDPSVRNFKKTPCKFFMLGQCAKGDACTFSHGENGESMALPPQAADPGLAAAPWRAQAMGMGEMGGGMGGGMPFKKTPCKFFQQGICAKGDACTFAHTMDGGCGMSGGKGWGKGGCGKGTGKGYDWGAGSWDTWSMMKGMMTAKGKDKGKGKGKSGNKGKGHLLPRTRISEAPFTGTVVEWKGKFGWIQPAETIEHSKAAKHDGKLFVGMDDTPNAQGLPAGTMVTFHIWEDPSGLGADEINLV